jgi:hypothetical protein
MDHRPLPALILGSHASGLYSVMQLVGSQTIFLYGVSLQKNRTFST